MNSSKFYNKKLGILGGGQLGKMLCIAAADWHIETYVLDPNSDCSAAHICNKFIVGSFTNFTTVYEFGKMVDLLTIEIENVNIEALLQLQQEGKEIHPNPKVIKIIKDKGLQKQFFLDHHLNTSNFIFCNSVAEIISLIDENKIEFPFVQKLRTEGYDGRGVAIIQTKNDLFKLLDAASIIEPKVKIEKELSVIAARDVFGNIECFTTVEMVFDDEANLVKYLICPASISEEINSQAIKLATKTIKAFNMVGLLAVEMFLDEHDNVLINEVAPRPHNSGHHTIENAFTSQFEQLIRAVMGLPLGTTKMILPAVMLNVLGEKNFSGNAIYEGIENCLAQEGVHIHLYGKTETRPNRKMGHVTIINESIDKAKSTAHYINEHLKVIV